MKYTDMKPFAFDLQLFAEGGAAGDGGNGTGAEGLAAEANAETPLPHHKRRERENPLADVKYGIQQGSENNAQEQTAQETPAAKPTFEELIKGEYKADYDKRVADTIQKRLRGAKATEEAYAKTKPLMQILSERYGTDDPEKLAEALGEDKTLFESEAIEKGIPVETYMAQKNAERKLAAFEAKERAAQESANAQAEYTNLLKQATELAANVPNFNLDAEMANPQFARMVLQPPHGVGIPLESAYYAMHRAEIEAAQKQQQMALTGYAVQQTQQKVAASIAANNNRPAEYGAGAASPATAKTDIASLTRADRDEIRRRVARGERIVF